MYKVFAIGGGWSVFYLDSPESEPRLVPHTDQLGNVVPYKYRQAAYRRCKKLNHDLKEIQAMIDRDGAIIL